MDTNNTNTNVETENKDVRQEEKNNNGNKAIILVLGLVTVLVALVGATFAYFTAQINKPNGDQSVAISTTTVQGIEYTSGDPLIIKDAIPGVSSSTKFSVRNPNTAANASYTLSFVPIEDTFTNTDGANQLVVTVTGGSLVSPVELDYTDGANAVKQTVAADVNIDANKTDEYEATVKFAETQVSQNTNQGKNFSGYFEVTQSHITAQND